MPSTDTDRSVRRPAEPSGIASVDNAIHSIKADLMDMEDRLIERMDDRFDKVDRRIDKLEVTVGERFDSVEGRIDKIIKHLGIDDA